MATWWTVKAEVVSCTATAPSTPCLERFNPMPPAMPRGGCGDSPRRSTLHTTIAKAGAHGFRGVSLVLRRCGEDPYVDVWCPQSLRTAPCHPAAVARVLSVGFVPVAQGHVPSNSANSARVTLAPVVPLNHHVSAHLPHCMEPGGSITDILDWFR